MSRITGLSVLLCIGMMVWAYPSYAGFEFSGPSAAPAAAPAQQAGSPAIDNPNAPMPIAPMPDVTSEPLAPMNAGPDAQLSGMSPVPADDQILKAPPSAAPKRPIAAAGEQVYIRRQRTTATVPAPQNEPMDTSALLKATENADAIAMTPEKINTMPANTQNGLVINPYPLDEQATHGGMGALPLEQAMMEQGGTLRPVATPGSNSTSGMRERARITSRYDSGSQYLPRERAPAAQADTSYAITSLTPFPGGEGEPLDRIESMPLTPPPAPQIPRPPEAVMQPAQQQPATSAVTPRVSQMPRPAVPQDYPTPISGQAAQQAPVPLMPRTAGTPAPAAGGYAEAVGFGRDLPLALALSQVVPPEYTYAFGQDVNVGSTVSWQGGKPWNQVLDEMLAQSGMRAIIQDNQITIVSART